MNLQHIVIIAGLVAISIGCGNRSDDSRTAAVFGPDNRVPVPDSYSFVGDYGGICTAFAVSPRLIMTAAHCTFSDREYNWTTHGTRQTFQTTLLARGMASSQAREHLYAAQVVNDWAILKLDRPHRRWHGIATDLALGAKVALMGYSYDREGLSGNNDCEVKSLKHGIIGHDCDMRDGASGAPMMRQIDGKWSVVGIQSTENCESGNCIYPTWTDRNSNRACALTAEIAATVQRYREIFDSE